MNTFKVFISETAIKQLGKLDLKVKKQIIQRLKELHSDPFRSRPLADIKKLKGYSKLSLYRLRIGDFRAIYVIQKNSVKITEIIKRKKGYKWLE